MSFVSSLPYSRVEGKNFLEAKALRKRRRQMRLASASRSPLAQVVLSQICSRCYASQQKQLNGTTAT